MANISPTYMDTLNTILQHSQCWPGCLRPGYKEINRVVVECDPAGAGVDLSVILHVRPITWDNVIDFKFNTFC